MVKFDVFPEILPHVKYIWSIFLRHVETSDPLNEIDLTIGQGERSDIKISGDFHKCIEGRKYDHQSLFRDAPLFLTESGKPDYLGTAFYLINSLQEHDSELKDKFGRFPYEASLQSRFECSTENLVIGYFRALFKQTSQLKSGLKWKDLPSGIFVSHDIDLIRGALYEDGVWAIKKGRFDILLSLIWMEFISDPYWLNIDQIMNINDEHDVKSTFFWLVRNGKARINGQEISNANYHFKSPSIQNTIQKVSHRGFFNGLHKSISTDSIQDEISQFQDAPEINRNHYLLMQLPNHYHQIEESGIKLDCTLGFAPNHGFRNSYGLPFQPFNMFEKRPYRFVEVPLHLMDATFRGYHFLEAEQAERIMIEFIESHQTNCLISVLWHNNFFSNYKYAPWLNVYKRVLSTCREMGLKSWTPRNIIENYLTNGGS